MSKLPRRALAWAAGTGLLGALAPAQDAVAVDARLPSYVQVSGVSGSLKSVGSDTMNNLMTFWGEGFRKKYPNVDLEIEGKGSSTAPPALIEGTATFGPMSRPMKASEIDAFEKAYGYKPTQLPTAIDMLAVYVHKDNPIVRTGLTLQQVDAIFSKTRKGGAMRDARTWGALGLTGEWADKPISLYGRNSASGTYGYFKEIALFDGDYKDEVKEQQGSSAVVQGVASDKYGIGYSGIGYLTADVRAVPLADEGDPVAPTAENVSDYPISRYLYLSLNHEPGSSLDPLRREFVRYVLSRDGQQIVVKDGYLSLSYLVCAKALQQLGLKLVPARAVEAGLDR